MGWRRTGKTRAKRAMRALTGVAAAVVVLVAATTVVSGCGGRAVDITVPGTSVAVTEAASMTSLAKTTTSTLSLHERIQQEQATSTTQPTVTKTQPTVTTAQPTVTTAQPAVITTTTVTKAPTTTTQPTTSTTASSSGPLRIVSVHSDAAGDDNNNLNDEYIEFEVLISGSLQGYAVEDEYGWHYDFPSGVFSAGQVFKLRTGSGTDTGTDLYWGKTATAIWNNGGDTVKVLDSGGQIVLSQSY
jgi:hypothetical protein